MSTPLRIAMWSGPRNISTAMLRSFGNRPDTFVTDEPLYGHYLRQTGLDHPGRDEVIAAQPEDWQTVATWLCGPVPEGQPVWYQKHMSHHLLPEIEQEWLGTLSNCFLIRDPREVLASYTQVRETVTLEDIGLPQQAALFDRLFDETGAPPPVLDAKDVLSNPEKLLGALCTAIGLDFTETMLSWPPGPRDTDGIWSKYWYSSVTDSTGFVAYKPKNVVLTPALEELAARCAPYYERLHAYRLGQ
ncbi:MAG: hypothetical protein OXT06_15625 [Rhodospirillaceae bacterium]|nr:hypothetical protein [Rhodospirillaceae bacterium]MDD9915159.1 hypothetical protein [Rhodospirillaceae bacterium]MDD9926762.1 hypothetical protein [Rhodospirillaceae bacterium]